MSERNSYLQILRSSSIIGGASVINILVGLLRIKVAAVLLGPAGVGMIGFLQNLMATAAAVAALGFGTVGTRQIAEAVGLEDEQAVAASRRALFWGTLLLAFAGGALFWALRDTLAEHVLSDRSLGETVGWLAVGVSLTVASGSQGALLNGLRRLGDLARLSVGAALFSTALGVAALWAWGDRGVLVFVLAAPLASFVLGHWYVVRLPSIGGQPTPLRVLVLQWKNLVRLGAAFMVSGLAVALGVLLVRAMIQRELGVDALGHFQAAWAISMTYIGFVLGAMGTDFYPRLTTIMHDHAAVNRLVNQQSEVALLLAGPAFLAMLGLAPWLIEALYSDRFGNAVSVLRWQVLGDVLKVASWPLGFIILAAGDGRTFMITELLMIAVFVGLTWIGLPFLGIQAAGAAFLCLYALYLPLVYWLAWRRTGFSWERRVGLQLVALIAVALSVFLAAGWSKWIAAGFGVFSAVLFGFHAFVRLGHIAEFGGPLGRLAGFSRKVMIKTGIKHD